MKLRLYLWIILLLQGCALSHSSVLYQVKMLSGDVLYARNAPTEDKDGFYHFRDVNKQSYVVQKNLVLYIQPEHFLR